MMQFFIRFPVFTLRFTIDFQFLKHIQWHYCTEVSRCDLTIRREEMENRTPLRFSIDFQTLL